MNQLELARVAVRRGEVVEQIVTCRACTLAPGAQDPETGTPAVAHAPVPFRGSAPFHLMMLGEAPGGTEDRRGRPFAGAAGGVLTRMVEETGAPLPPLHKWFIANSVCCRSLTPPSAAHLSACLPNLRAQIALANPDWVVVLGATALAATGFKGQVTKLHGRPFYAPAGPFIGRWVMPTIHPAAILRDPEKAPILASDLSTLRNLLTGRISQADVQCRVGRNGKLVI